MTVSSICGAKILLCGKSGKFLNKIRSSVLGTTSLHSAFSLWGHFPAGTRSRPLTPKGSPLSNRQSPQTLKRTRVTTSLQALATGTELTDQNGKHWTLGALQIRDDQGILYEAEPTSAVPSESRTQKWRFSLKLDSKDGRLFNEQNFFQRVAKPLQVNKWKKQFLLPLLAIPTCIGFGIHQDKYRFLVFPSLGRSLQSALDDNPKHVVSERCVLQVACRLVRTSKPSHILFKPQLPHQADKVIFRDAQRAECQWSSPGG